LVKSHHLGILLRKLKSMEAAIAKIISKPKGKMYFDQQNKKRVMS
jgi:hypothetical protein